jgi:outer membrane protein assembly factor BamB
LNSTNAVSLPEKKAILKYFGNVAGDVVYYPTWSCLFVALNYKTCQLVWEIIVTTYIYDYAVPDKLPANYTYSVSRTSATFDGDILYFGSQTHALLVALNRTSGNALANLQINAHQFAVLTTSPTIYNHTIFHRDL